MTDLNRSARSRRGGRRPGWVLLTVLLVLAIGASSALVFTNRVELLKLAVILALWAAVVAAFVSVIYRRQSDVDQAKVRDLKLVYDLQLDREISARREYELSVEAQLRKELSSEIRAQAADEVAGLRAELAALRTNLEILFDADLSHRPAIETDRSYGDWAPRAETAGRVTASRIDTEDRADSEPRTDESPIIDVPAEPTPPDHEWADASPVGGAHRRASEMASEARRHAAEEAPAPPPPPPQPPAPPPPPPHPVPQYEPQPAWTPPQPPPAPTEPVGWRPAPAEGQWIPAGAPGSNWVAPEQPVPPPPHQPAMSTTSAEPRRGRHSAPPDATDPGRPSPPPTMAAEPPQPHAEPVQPESTGRRHRNADGPETGGQSVAELLARLQATPSGGGRRRRRDE